MVGAVANEHLLVHSRDKLIGEVLTKAVFVTSKLFKQCTRIRRLALQLVNRRDREPVLRSWLNGKDASRQRRRLVELAQRVKLGVCESGTDGFGLSPSTG